MTSQLRVLRLYHSAVVSGFRRREHALRDHDVDLTLISPRRWNEGGEVVDLDLREDEQEWVVPTRTFGRHPYRFAYNPLSIARELRRARPAIIDAQEEPGSLAVAEVLLLRRLLAPKATLTLYSAQNVLKQFPVPFRWFEQWSFRRAHTIYCCNEEAADVLRKKGYRGHAPVLGLGVDTDHFKPLPKAPSDALRLLYVGRLEPHKGVHVLIHALREISCSYRLEVVGAGSARYDLEELANASGVEVVFRDFVPHEELPQLYQNAEVLVIPSIPMPTAREQFGRVAVEAMASGLAIIASDTGALPQVVGPGGLIVTPEDEVALAEAIETLATDPSLRHSYGEAGHRWCARYAWPEVARMHFDIYRAAADE